MPKSLLPVEFLEKIKTIPCIDVRSPGEYLKAHIPSAHNIPLFENEERAKVGTRYKQQGKDNAVLLGLDIVGPKLAGFVKKVNKICGENREIAVHCWRGGMRSGSFAWLLETAGYTVYILKGGYKAYRNHVLQSFDEQRKLIVIGGKTGSGKTETLLELAKNGQQIIDLEGLAHHKGSSFGALGQLAQPQTEMFENLVHQQWSLLDATKPIWIEDESKNVGSCMVPQGLFLQIRAAKVAFLEVPLEERLKFLVGTYGIENHDGLVSSVNKIEKRLGGQHHKAALIALQSNDYKEVARITLIYYDKAYLYGVGNRLPETIKTINVLNTDPKTNAKILLDFIKNL
jgi:tRNA 2-selenouridine synthase